MINIPKGTKDVLPDESGKWQFIEEEARKTASSFCAQEIRTPVFEHTELFLRGVGDTTDVVTKEMYTFLDKKGRSITLKPEGTAGVARSLIENNLDANGLPCKLFYFTQAYRYENTQKGRLREHHQFGVEFFGSSKPEMDAEVISLAYSFLSKLGISQLVLNVNSIGCPECRKEYNKVLKEYLSKNIGSMCGDCKDRLEKNPLRILDCKVPVCKEYNEGAPKIIDYICGDCKAHMDRLLELLTLLKIPYQINPYIVRGLDYYNRTVFEFVTTALGTQGTVCGGGRYDGLTENIGGKALPACGFGMGIERLIMLMDTLGIKFGAPALPKLYIASMDTDTTAKAAEIVFALRKENIPADYDTVGRSLKAQFKYADKCAFEYVLVLGSDEMAKGSAKIKRMKDGKEEEVRIDPAVIAAVVK